MNRSISALAAIMILGSGCTGAAAPTGLPGSSSDAPGPASRTAGHDAWLAVGRSDAAAVEIIRAHSGELLRQLPLGVPVDTEWGSVVAVDSGGGRTTVRELALEPGRNGAELSIEGQWRLPSIGSEPLPVGLSAPGPGQRVVLVEAAAPPDRKVSRFAIVPARPLDEPTILAADGHLDYDAISPDGSTLYVAEYLSTETGHYQVRAVDVATGVMDEQAIVDKRNLGAAMVGWPVAQLRQPGGRVLTLYRGSGHAFIHALDTVERWAVCIDLPHSGWHGADADWDLAASPDGRSIYAVNATGGVVVEIDPVELVIRRSASLEPAPTKPATPGEPSRGPVGRRALVTTDGAILLVAAEDGILAISTASLTVAARFLPAQSVEGLAMTPDGRALFALVGTGGRILELDPASSDILGAVPGDGYARLLAAGGD